MITIICSRYKSVMYSHSIITIIRFKKLTFLFVNCKIYCPFRFQWIVFNYFINKFVCEFTYFFYFNNLTFLVSHSEKTIIDKIQNIYIFFIFFLYLNNYAGKRILFPATISTCIRLIIPISNQSYHRY